MADDVVPLDDVVLAVDTGELAHLRAELAVAADELSLVRARIGASDGLAVGARPVLVELDRLAADWGGHVGRLAGVAERLGTGLADAGAGYDRCEADAVGRALAAGRRPGDTP